MEILTPPNHLGKIFTGNVQYEKSNKLSKIKMLNSALFQLTISNVMLMLKEIDYKCKETPTVCSCLAVASITYLGLILIVALNEFSFFEDVVCGELFQSA